MPPVDDVLRDAEGRMKKSIEALRRELSVIRTGRASTSMVEHITADYYGTPTPLNQLGTISTPEARMITIQAWDRQAVASIEKAIQKSDLGLNPSTDGTIVRIPVPALTEERRRDLTKVVRKRLEEDKIAIRNVRRDAIENLRAKEKAKEMSEDELRRGQEKLQTLTDAYIKQADQLGAQKEADLLEV